MIERTNVLSLRELVSQYPFVLMDSSILYEKLSTDAEKSSEEKENYIGERLKFFGLLEESLHEGLPFFTTFPVSQEYIGGNFPYKKIIKKREMQDRASLDKARRIVNMRKRGRRMVDLLYEKGRIIELTEEEKRKYNFLKNTYYGQSFYELGEVDADLLISGIVLSETRGATCLASNDFGIFHKWKCFLNGYGKNKEQFGFAVRLDLNSFKLLNNNHIHQG